MESQLGAVPGDCQTPALLFYRLFQVTAFQGFFHSRMYNTFDKNEFSWFAYGFGIKGLLWVSSFHPCAFAPLGMFAIMLGVGTVNLILQQSQKVENIYQQMGSDSKKQQLSKIQKIPTPLQS